MKRALIFITLLIAAVLPAGAQGSNVGGPGDGGIFTTRLKDGLQVVVVEDHAAPVVQTAMWYHFGSLDETPGKTGLAHALEHMMFRGTSNISAGGLDDIVARLGAEMNGETSYDDTHYYFVMPSDKLDVGLYIAADRMHNLLLRQSDWNVERGAVLNELAGDEGSPFFDLLARVRAAAYPGQPAGRVPIGLKADVERATVKDIRKYYEEWYAPNNATLVVAGDVSHETVFAKAARDFADIPARKLPPQEDARPIPVSHTVTVQSRLPFPFEILDLAYAVPGDSEPGEPAVSTLVQAISNQLSPFYQALVQTNVALAVEADEDTQLKGGLFNVFIVLNPGHTSREAQQIFQSTLDGILKNGWNPDLIAAAKRLTIAERMYAGDSITGMGDLAGYTYGIVGEKIHDEDDRLAALTPQSILDVTRRYLRRPTVIGHLRTSAGLPAATSQKSTTSISDDFSKRIPNGPIIEPPAIRKAVRTPTTARSKLHPVEFRLSNGLTVLVQEKTDRPTFVITGEIASSPSFGAHGKEGIARLASAVADYGSARYPFVMRRRAIDMMGAVVHNGQSFGARGLVRDFSRVTDILADGEEHPTFADPWFSIERGQLANSLASEATISGVMISRAYARLLAAPTDPSLRLPTSATVTSITRNDLLDYAKHYWRPDLTTIAVVGDVTPQQVKAAFEQAFGGWAAQGPTPNAHELPYPASVGGHDYVSTEATQVYVRLGQPALARDNPDYPAFLVLNQILGASGNFESRLWQGLRQKRGLVYSVASSLHAARDRGDFRVELNANPGRVVEAVNFVRDAMKNLQQHPVTQTELQEAKLRLVGNALLEEASASGQASQLLDIGVSGLPLDYYTTLSERFAGVTAADVERVARRYLRPGHLDEIFAGPQGIWAQQNL